MIDFFKEIILEKEDIMKVDEKDKKNTDKKFKCEIDWTITQKTTDLTLQNFCGYFFETWSYFWTSWAVKVLQEHCCTHFDLCPRLITEWNGVL